MALFALLTPREDDDVVYVLSGYWSSMACQSACICVCEGVCEVVCVGECVCRGLVQVIFALDVVYTDIAHTKSDEGRR